jgi:hypothetical protein
MTITRDDIFWLQACTHRINLYRGQMLAPADTGGVDFIQKPTR